MAHLVSVVIPNRNGAATIGRCLDAVHASRGVRFEVVVVDDASEDESVGIVERFPCTLVRLATHQGAGRARNAGAAASRGTILFFTDADCLLEPQTLALAAAALSEAGSDAVVGGTYTASPADAGFFNAFQSVLIRHNETRRAAPDYVATHAMAIAASTFRRHGGFADTFLPILEDVEFSHRLRRSGCRLVVVPAIQVRHVFGFSLLRSARNAARKSLYWTAYALGRRQLLGDSGTASTGLKVNVIAWAAAVLLVGLSLVVGSALSLAGVLAVVAANLLVNRDLIRAFHAAGGSRFTLAALLYYVAVYPLPVGAGALAGVAGYVTGRLRPAGA